VSLSGLLLLSRTRNVNVALVLLVVDVGVGVGVGVDVGVGVGVGAGVATGAGVTDICAVFWEVMYPVFVAIAVMVHVVVWEKLAAVKFVW